MVSTLLTLALIQPAASLEVRVEGEGYLRFMREGRMVFARSASLTVAQGALVHVKGLPVSPSIEGFRPGEKPSVAPNGEVKALASTGSSRILGRLSLALFPPDIRPVESQGFLIAAERPKILYPGTGTAGTIAAGPAGAKASPTLAGPVAAAPQNAVRPSVQPRPEPAGLSQPLSLGLKADVEVDRDKILIGDLAEVSGAGAERAKGLDIGATPALGVTRPVDRSSIEARLARAGFLIASVTIQGPDKVNVARKCQKVTQDQFVEAARQAVNRTAGTALNLEPAEPGPPMAVPLGELVLTSENASLVRDIASATIAVYVDGRRINSRTVRLKVSTPLTSLKIGQTVAVRVKARTASVQTSGRISAIDIARDQVSVQTATGALLTGRLASDGAIEVAL